MQTNIIVLRALQNDAEDIFKIRNEQNVLKYLDAYSFESKEACSRWLNELNGGAYNYLKVISYNNEVAGLIYLSYYNTAHHYATLSFFLGEAYTNKKIMRTAIIDYLTLLKKQAIVIHRAETYVHEHNEHCHKLMNHAGFKKEGIIKENFLKNGIYHHSILYGKIM